MNAVKLLSRLHQCDITLWVEDGQLCYEAPEAGIPQAFIDQIKVQKTELIDLLKNSLLSDNDLELVPVSRKENLPLSFAQERLWVLHHLFPESPAYNIPMPMRFSGELNLVGLQKSLQALVNRHEPLRSYFPTVDNDPVQVIHEEMSLPLVQHDLRALPHEEREAAAFHLVEKESFQPFDLATGPVIRATLIRLGEVDHILLLTLHHIVTDGWSRGIIHRDLATFYNAHVTKEAPVLPDLPVQYADFAHWQRQWLSGEVLDEQLQYWRHTLADVPNLALPTDRPRPAVQTHVGASHSFGVGKSLTEGLHTLSRDTGGTLAITLLAAFQLLLARYTGQTDIAVGSPIANRTRPEIENLVGFFVNSLVMRTDQSGDPTFGQLLARVNQVNLGAYDHQDLPFEQLVEELQPARDFSRNPLFQVMFTVQNLPKEGLEFKGLTVKPFGTPITTTRMDLECFVWEGPEGLNVNFVYNTDLFDAPTIERLSCHFQRMLHEIVRDPAQRLSQISLLTGEERQHQLVEWNTTQTEYPREAAIAELFDAQVAQTPEAVAVVCGEDTLTYTELDTRANLLAHYLQQQGVGPEVCVGLCVERSLEMVVGVLGILKAGGAYVPLDPSLPLGRVAFILEDAGIAVLLTQASLRATLPEFAGTVLALDAEWATMAQMPVTTVVSGVTAKNLAYIMYTSGSTGRPKGVSICHRNVVRLVTNTNYLHVGPDETFLQFAPLAFDASTLELWGSLLHGATLVICPPHILSLEELAQIIHDHQISTLWLTAAVFHQMVDVQPDALGRVRQLLAGGEVLSVSHVQRFIRTLKEGHRFINGYGPTENTTFTCCEMMTTDTQIDSSVPIGRPIANTQVYVLDQAMRPVPLRVYGELYVGGDGLARNYFSRPSLTAEKFVPHPFSVIPGERLYRTGDLVRYRRDGTLEFKGRVDDQIKLRGYRIELGEIETVLSQHSDVQDVVVMVREDGASDKRLVAYVSGVDSTLLTVSDLRGFMDQKVPGYMIPSTFVLLDTLPLTPNGKVDRQALPAPDFSRPELTQGFEAPRGDVEITLAKIWREILAVDSVGIHDNFFDLGGHSLLATRVVSRVREAFHVELSLRAFFNAPTVAGLARCIEDLSGNVELLGTLPLVPCSRDHPLPLSFAQQRLWFLYQLQPESPAYNMPLRFHLSGSVNIKALHQSLQALVDRHETLRTRFPAVGGDPCQVILAQIDLPLPMQDLRYLPLGEWEVAAVKLAKEEARQPFNLETGPVIRTTLLQLPGEEYILLLTLHHIISDGWSLGVFSRELAAFYKTFIDPQTPALPPLSIQYADFAHWQRERLTGEVLENHLAYWRNQLDGVAMLQLPTDRPRPAIQKYDAGGHAFQIDSSLMSGLYALSRQNGVTLAITLLAAFQVILSRYTGQMDIAVGSPIANRTRGEIEGLIGFFVNSLVMRTNLSGNPTFLDVIRRVQDVAVGAYDHQDLPFEKLVEELSPERDTSQNPLFQVMFAVQNAQYDGFTLPGVEVRPFNIGSPTTRFDLECHVWEGPEHLQIVFNYKNDLFEAETISRFGKHFHQVLEEVVRDPAQRLSDISILDREERRYLLENVNQTEREYPRERCIHQLFEDQVEKTPEAFAVVFGDQILTYRELNRRANQLARTLRRHGVGPDRCVGLYVERSVESIVGILGILKAGGAYVPLDLNAPPGRLAFMLEDAGITVLLTEASLRQSLPEFAGTVLALDAEGDTIAQIPATNVGSGVTAEHLAYIIYTSGSTGLSKGITIPHRAVTRLVLDTNYVELESSDRVAQIATLSFDAATFEIWGALLNGAQLVIIPKVIALSPPDFATCLQQYGVTTLFLTTALFNQMARETPDAFQTIRHLLFGGEAVDPQWVREVLRTAAPQRLLHVYGPTESTTFTTWHLTDRVSPGEVTVPIGQPLANTQVYVLDQHLNLVPVGVFGELYIGGDGLARNYLQQPALTAEKFVPHPFSQELGARLYKSGDLVRYRADGMLEFKGRRDTQVKLRGYRIELGEIETVLSQHPSVAEAVAVVREDQPDDQRLVAYVVPDHEQVESLIREEGGDWATQHISDWHVLYEQTYGDPSLDLNPMFNISGWNSSYTGKSIPTQEMGEWVNGTVKRILGLEPKDVLEIGCGTGLLLYRIAPHCQKYVATDFSEVALKQVKQVKDASKELSHVSLEHRLAENFEGFKFTRFDTVILNSVTQYFPSMDYLFTVLEGAVESVREGGKVFIGDVRSLPLLEVYHASVQLYQATNSLPTTDLDRHIRQAVVREEELVIDPEFFQALQQRLSRLSHVEVLLKQGYAHNELTRFRYDVILHVDIPKETKDEIQWLDWSEVGSHVGGIRSFLQDQRPLWVGVQGIPNARIAHDVAILDSLAYADSPPTVGVLRGVGRRAEEHAIDPQELWDAMEGLPYWCELGYEGSGADGQMIAMFRRRELEVKRPWVMGGRKWSRMEIKPWKAYGTDPLKTKLVKNLVPSLRDYMKIKVPEYLFPTAYVVMETLPLTPNGKVDRRVLPMPEGGRVGLRGQFLAPRTPLEKTLAKIWCDVLGIEKVSIQDDFFDLGGHSLLAVKLLAQIEKQCGTHLPLSALLRASTVEQTAKLLESHSSTIWSTLVPIQTEGSKPPLFCCHGGRGEILWYRLLARHLSPDQPMYGLQPLGLDGDMPFHLPSRMDTMVRPYTDAILAKQPEGPILIVGRCYGGFIAFEVAQQLMAAGREVDLVAVLDSGPPILPFMSKNPMGIGERLVRGIKMVFKRVKNRISLVDRIQREKTLILGSFQEKRTLQLRDAQAEAIGNYHARVYPGSLTLLRSEGNHQLPEKDYHLIGWQALAKGGFSYHLVPGDHMSMLQEPLVGNLGKKLQECIDEVIVQHREKNNS